MFAVAGDQQDSQLVDHGGDLKCFAVLKEQLIRCGHKTRRRSPRQSFLSVFGLCIKTN